MIRCRFRFAAVAGLAFLAFPGGSARAAEPRSPAARALTPETLGFLHVRVSDLWTSDVAAQLRKFTAQAGPDLIAAFEKRFVPAPSEIESFTVILASPDFREILPAGRPSDVTPIWVVTTKQPYDRVELLKTMAKGGRTKKHAGAQFFFEEAHWAGLYLIDDRTFAYGSEESITGLLDRMVAEREGSNALRDLFEAEAGKHPITIGVNVPALVQPELLKNLPDELHSMMKAKTWLTTLDLTGGTKITVTLNFATEAQAVEGQKGARATIEFGRKFLKQGLDFVETKARGDGQPGTIVQFPETVGLLLAAAGLKQLDGLLAGLPITVKGTTVQASLNVDGILPGGSTAISIGMVALAVGYGVELAMQGERSRQMTPQKYELDDRERRAKQIADAVEKYRKARGQYPPPYTTGKNGQPLLSWRVELLPYLEYTYLSTPYVPGVKETKPLTAPDLYKMFNHDEPWDGPTNKKLIERMPDVYRAPYYVLPYNAYGKTTTVAVVGRGAIFDPDGKVTIESVTDGTSNTLLLFMHEESSKATYWTKPSDVQLTGAGTWPADGPKLDRRLTLGFAEGSSRTFEKGLPEKSLIPLVTRAGGELPDKDVLPTPRKDPKGTPPSPSSASPGKAVERRK